MQGNVGSSPIYCYGQLNRWCNEIDLVAALTVCTLRIVNETLEVGISAMSADILNTVHADQRSSMNMSNTSSVANVV